MGKVPTFPRESMLSLYAEPLYDISAIRELLMLVGPPPDATDVAEAVAFPLNELGKAFAFDLYGEVQASTPQREKEAKRLADACARVLAIAGVADGGELFPIFAEGGLFAAAHIRGEAQGKAATMNALRAVDLLQQDALMMLEVEGKRRRMKPPQRGRPVNKALDKLVRDLSCMFENLWGRAPGVSGGDDPSGPFLRLMVNVTDRLRARGIRFSSSPDSLRKVWQRLPDDEKMPLTVIMRQCEALDGEAPRDERALTK